MEGVRVTASVVEVEEAAAGAARGKKALGLKPKLLGDDAVISKDMSEGELSRPVPQEQDDSVCDALGQPFS